MPQVKIATLKISAVGSVPKDVWRKFKPPQSVNYLEMYDGPLAAEALADVDWSVAASLRSVILRNLKGSPPLNLSGLVGKAPALKSLHLEQAPAIARDLSAGMAGGRLEHLRIVNSADHWTADDVLSMVRQGKNLAAFHFHSASLQDALVPALVESLPNLKEMSLGGAQLTDVCTAPLKNLRWLEDLGLNCPKLSMKGISEIKRIRGLKKLNLVQPNVSRIELEQFRAKNPSMQIAVL